MLNGCRGRAELGADGDDQEAITVGGDISFGGDGDSESSLTNGAFRIGNRGDIKSEPDGRLIVWQFPGDCQCDHVYITSTIHCSSKTDTECLG